LTVARFFRREPDTVERWALPDFHDRQEYMWIVREIERQSYEDD